MSLESRLAKLEHRVRGNRAKFLMVYQQEGETEKQAVARTKRERGIHDDDPSPHFIILTPLDQQVL